MLKLPPQGRWRSVHQTLHFPDGQELPHGTQEFGALHTRQNDWKMDRFSELVDLCPFVLFPLTSRMSAKTGIPLPHLPAQPSMT